MPDNYALYSQAQSLLPEAQMQSLAAGTVVSVEAKGSVIQYVLRWPDLKITCAVMPPGQVREHLRGFAGYVRHLYSGDVDERGRRIIARILRTTLVVGVEVEPKRDEQGRAGAVLNQLCSGLDPIVFYRNALFDGQSRLLLGPDKSFDADAMID